jgi:hypothetical protein
MKILDYFSIILTLVISLVVAPFYGLFSMFHLPVSAMKGCLSSIKTRRIIREVFDSMGDSYKELEETEDVFAKNALSKQLQKEFTNKVLERFGIPIPINDGQNDNP